MASYGEPFSSTDEIPDDVWAGAAQSWRDAQGRHDSVAGTRPMLDPEVAQPPIRADASLRLASADMPHDDWQHLRMLQLLGAQGAGGASQNQPGDSAAGRMADAAGAEALANQTAVDLIGRGLAAAERFAQRQFVGSNGEPANSANPSVRWAQGMVGSRHYTRISPAEDARGRLENHLPPVMRGIIDPKCNQFVYDALSAAGEPPGRQDGVRIPIASDWGDPRSKIGGYAPVTGPPQPGDVVSNGEHVGIYAPLADGSPGTISAASPHWPVLFHGSGGAMGGVVHNDWGFRPGQKVTIWRRAPR